MDIHTAERRFSTRMASAHPAVISNNDGRVLARGRTGNVSDNGVFVIARAQQSPDVGQTVLVELKIPSIPDGSRKQHRNRTVHFRAEVVRSVDMGQLAGIGLEFIEKLS